MTSFDAEQNKKIGDSTEQGAPEVLTAPEVVLSDEDIARSKQAIAKTALGAVAESAPVPVIKRSVSTLSLSEGDIGYDPRPTPPEVIGLDTIESDDPYAKMLRAVYQMTKGEFNSVVMSQIIRAEVNSLRSKSPTEEGFLGKIEAAINTLDERNGAEVAQAVANIAHRRVTGL